MKCPRCQNENKKYFYKGSKGWICRKCVPFKRQLIEESISEHKMDEIHMGADEIVLKYELTVKQKEIAYQCLQSVRNGQDVFVDSICGSGKTEITLASIQYYLKHQKRVGLAVARRQVVLDLYGRLKQIFKNAKVIAVCEGYTDVLEGDLILCTTHQLYRYPKSFDLLILDEPDAFPYKGNKVLEGIVKTSCKGNMIYLTATADEYLKQRIKNKDITHLRLFRRPHNVDLVVPDLIVAPFPILLICLIRWIYSHRTKALVFVPTIKMVKILTTLFRTFLKVDGCTSKTVNKDEIIQQFKNKKLDCLFATTILERGVTIEGVDVCVFHAHNRVFDEASLIQMSGRVGRSFKYPTGDCLFLSQKKSDVVSRCIQTCIEVNKHE